MNSVIFCFVPNQVCGVMKVGPRPADVSAQYAAVTGTTAMPQLFSLG